MSEVAVDRASGSLRTARPRFQLSAERVWSAAALLIAGLTLIPIVNLARLAAAGDGSVWWTVAPHVLTQSLGDTLLLLGGVAAIVIPVGAGSAWLVTAYEFPGRRILTWALLLPLAMPTYVVAFAYVDLLHPIGPVQSAIRAALGYARPSELRLWDIRSLGGAALLLGFALYPYVYLTTRALFLVQSASLLEVARTLGAGRTRTFFSVALPMARPAIAVGAALALMETLNDVGASSFLGVRPLTVAIQSVWLNQSDLAGASQLALVLLIIVGALAAIERAARGARRFATTSKAIRRAAPLPLSKPAGAVALAIGLLPVLIGFAAPFAHLALESFKRLSFAGLSAPLAAEIRTTVLLSLAAAIVATTAGVAMAYARRIAPGAANGIASGVASLGYALPGAILAIGLLPVTPWLAAGALIMAPNILVAAYLIRFLPISIGGIEAGLERAPRALDDAARSLGRGRGGVLTRVLLPLSLPSVAAAALLVFVECMKELPATLMLRPLNVETLATHLYGEAMRGTYEDGAIAALLIVLASLIPVMLLSRAPSYRVTEARRAPT